MTRSPQLSLRIRHFTDFEAYGPQTLRLKPKSSPKKTGGIELKKKKERGRGRGGGDGRGAGRRG